MTTAWPEGVVARAHEPLARHTPWRVGGPCEAFVVVHRRTALGPAITTCRELNLKRTVLGCGTRTVVRDGGLAGAVLRLGQDFVGITNDADGWWVGAATPLALLGARVDDGPLAALRWAPGSLGASLALDDGWDGWVDRVRFVQRSSERETAWCDVPSRTSVIFTAARIRRAGEGRVGPVLPWSWYAPVEDDAPADLVRESDLSATRLRSVLIPPAQADTLVNLGGATAKDMHLLQRSAIDRVHTARGVKLQDRMSWLGRT